MSDTQIERQPMPLCYGSIDDELKTAMERVTRLKEIEVRNSHIISLIVCLDQNPGKIFQTVRDLGQ